MSISRELRTNVRERAGNRCEYCGMAQDWEPFFVYHVEHVVARQHGGGDSLSNLALSCRHCNLLKGPNLTSLDPDNRTLVRLFDPRTQAWNEHFALVDGQIRGLTEIGRTTVFLLEMNAPHRVELRLVNRP